MATTFFSSLRSSKTCKNCSTISSSEAELEEGSGTMAVFSSVKISKGGIVSVWAREGQVFLPSVLASPFDIFDELRDAFAVGTGECHGASATIVDDVVPAG